MFLLVGWPELLPGSGSLSLLFSSACLRGTISSFYILLWREEPSESDQFQGLPEAILSCLLPILRRILAGLNVLTGEETANNSMWHDLCVEVREPFGGVISLFYHVGPGDETQIIQLDSKHLCTLTHLTSPHSLPVFSLPMIPFTSQFQVLYGGSTRMHISTLALSTQFHSFIQFFI